MTGRRTVTMIVLTGLAVGSAALFPVAAWAAPTTQVIQGDVLRLVSVADWDAASSLLPGEPVRWDVAISAEAPDPGTVRIAVSATGDAPLMIDASICTSAWEQSGCPGRETDLRADWSIPRNGSEITLAEIADTEVAHLRLVITLDPDDDGGTTDIRVHAQGAGESAVVGPGGGGLATTGLSPIVPLAAGVGALLVVTGVVLVLDRRRRALRDRGGVR